MLRQTSLEHQVTRGLWQEEKTNQHNRRKHQRRTHHETPPSVHLVEDSSNGVPQNLSKSNTELIERNKTPTLVTGHRLTNVHTNTTTFDTHTNPQNKSSRIHDVSGPMVVEGAISQFFWNGAAAHKIAPILYHNKLVNKQTKNSNHDVVQLCIGDDACHVIHTCTRYRRP